MDDEQIQIDQVSDLQESLNPYDQEPMYTEVSVASDGGAEISVGIDGFNMSLDDTSVGTIVVVFIVCMTIVSCVYMKYFGPARKAAKERRRTLEMKAMAEAGKEK